MNIAIEVLAAYVYLILFYTFFLAYASIQNVGWAKVPAVGKALLLPVGVVFYVMDVAFNITFGTLIFFQAPTIKTVTLSMRLKANINGPDGWRKTISSGFVNHFLLPFTQSY